MAGNPRSGNVTKSSHVFSQVPKAEIPRSTFDRSHSHKTGFDAGYLVPVFVDEALPGDTFDVSMTAFARLTTLVVPFMDNLYLDSHFFAVPIRLLWSNWQKFNGEQANPGDSTSFTIPTVAFTDVQIKAGTLPNYMGIGRSADAVPPSGTTTNYSALFFRAYNAVYNQWYRDENMVNSAPLSTGDGPDNATDYVLRKRGKRHDYFTSCLPWPQKGNAVSIPLGSTAPVVRTGSGLGDRPMFKGSAGNQDVTLKAAGLPLGSAIQTSGNVMTGALQDFVWSDTQTGLKTDLSTATAATINQLRQSFQIQKLLERDARGGTRYTEIVKAHFGVTSPDARLQRPEYLGGGSSPISLFPVAQTSATNAQPTPAGALSAYGTVVANRHGFTKSFTEHCILLGIVSIRADLTYQQGVNRMFKRSTRYDFYWPALSHIGEQAVLQGEIFADASAGNEAIVFGYQERYAEYRYKPSLITGRLQSVDATPLDVWHLSQKFTSAPTLNQAFIEETPPLSRVVAVASQPNFIFDSFFRMRCARPMPVYGVPGMMDHF